MFEPLSKAKIVLGRQSGERQLTPELLQMRGLLFGFAQFPHLIAAHDYTPIIVECLAITEWPIVMQRWSYGVIADRAGTPRAAT